MFVIRRWISCMMRFLWYSRDRRILIMAVDVLAPILLHDFCNLMVTRWRWPVGKWHKVRWFCNDNVWFNNHWCLAKDCWLLLLYSTLHGVIHMIVQWQKNQHCGWPLTNCLWQQANVGIWTHVSLSYHHTTNKLIARDRDSYLGTFPWDLSTEHRVHNDIHLDEEFHKN